MYDIVDGKLVITTKNFEEDERFPYITLVFDIARDDIIDAEWYFNEEEAKLGHEHTSWYVGEEKGK